MPTTPKDAGDAATSSQSPHRPELKNLMNLEELWLAKCNLIGLIPASLGRLSRLKNLDLSENRLNGSKPNLIFHLKSIVQMELYNNSITGVFPAEGWSNLIDFRRFDASMNGLSGTISYDLCELPLESFNLFNNQLKWLILESIAKSPNLHELKLFENSPKM